MAAAETATFLFTDLVGSTSLASGLGREHADALRQEHFALLRSAVNATGGIEVKNLGDGLMVMFTSPSRALACAVAIQQAIERRNRRADHPLSVRTGLSMGEVVEEDGDYFGDPVVEAARLCATADGGQIITTEALRMIVGRHAVHELVPIGALSLKGFPDPLPAVEVRWEPEADDDSDAVPLPGRLVADSAAGLFGFFGRTDELAVLHGAQKAVVTDERLHMAFIGGEPGMGKTTLAAQAARGAHADGAVAAFGGCEEGLSAPYQPWIAVLSHLVQHAEPDQMAVLSPVHRSVLARLLPANADRLGGDDVPAGDADTERFLLLEAVAATLAGLSRTRPVVVVLDDLHWTDAASVQLLRHLVATDAAMRVLVIVTYRDSDLSRSHPLSELLADLWSEPRVQRIALRGLGDTEIQDLMTTAAGHDLDEAGVGLANALRRETDGNPFFVTELLRHLGESGAIVQGSDGRYTLATDDMPLPNSVRDVIARRVGRLGDDTHRVLSVAAVIGRDFDLDLLATAAERDEDDLVELLDAASAAGLVFEVGDIAGRYRFEHALIQHTLYADLSATRRQRTHQRIGELLEGGDAAPTTRIGELARHWIAATRPADVSKAVGYATAAGDAALAALAPLDAIDWYTRALELLERAPSPDEATRGRLLVATGRAQARTGDSSCWATLKQAAEVARRTKDGALLVETALVRSSGSETQLAADPDMVALLEDALSEVGDGDSPERARLLAALAEELDPRDWRRRRVFGADAVATARRAGDPATLLTVLNATSRDVSATELADERLRRTDEALALATDAGPVERFQSIYNRMLVEIELGELEAGVARFAEMTAISQQTGLMGQEWQVLQIHPWLDLLEGRADDAERAAEACLAVGIRVNEPIALASYGAQLSNIRRHQGRLEEIIGPLEKAIEANPALPVLRIAGTLVLCELGRLDEARELFARDIAEGLDLPHDSTWPTGMARYAEISVRLGDRDAATSLYDRLLPYADRVVFNTTVFAGTMSYQLGSVAAFLGRAEEAEAHFRHALERHRRWGAQYWIARTALEYADLLITQSRPAEAAALVNEADDLIERYGCDGLALRAAEVRQALRSAS